MTVLSLTSNAADQIKKILSDAPDGIDSVLVGIDNSGCSGYSYKLDFAKLFKVMRSPCWIFDTRNIINTKIVKSFGFNVWKLGDGSFKD